MIDKRIELTESQRITINNYIKACQELNKSGVKAIYRIDELYFINGKNVTDINYSEHIEYDVNEDVVEVNFDDIPCYYYPYDFAVALKDEPSFAVKIKK